MYDKSLPLTPHTAELVGDALVASRPRELGRWWPDTGDHKGRPYETTALVHQGLSYTHPEARRSGYADCARHAG